MKYVRFLLVWLAIGLTSTPAHAAIIGLIGIDLDPQSIFDPTEQAVDLGCAVADYDFCAEYELPSFPEGTFELHSIDFRLRMPSGDLYSTAGVNDDCLNSLCVDDEVSDLAFLSASPLFADGFTFRLFDDTIFCPPGSGVCPVEFFSNTISPGLSVVGVNGEANAGVTAVPEPATLLLVGPAVAALVRRRRQRSKCSPDDPTTAVSPGTSPPAGRTRA